MSNQIMWEPEEVAESDLFSIDPKAIKLAGQIGKGAFSVVHAGEYNEKIVAVKRQQKVGGKIPKYVLKEVSILNQLKHSNLLHYIGSCDHKSDGETWILTEYLGGGDVDQLLKLIRSRSLLHLGWERFLQIALDTAIGISFLHEQGIIHRDIKSSNILLDENYHTKLCDFGFAMDLKLFQKYTKKDGENPRRKSYCGTDAYMAPEMFLDEDYDESADIFSFGVVLMELICCKQANKDGFLIRLPQRKFQIDPEEYHSFVPDSCPRAFARLAERCVAFEPSERPSIHETVRELGNILQEWKRTTHKGAIVHLKGPHLKAHEPEEDELQSNHSCTTASDGGHEDEQCSDYNVSDDELDTCPNHAGPLLKRNRRGQRMWLQRWFMLDNGELHYSDVATQSVIGVNGIAAISTLSLAGCQVKRELQALTDEDMVIWMDAIERGINYANRHRECSGEQHEEESTVEPDEVYRWLEDIQMERFAKTLRDKGFSSLDFIRETGIEEDDLNFLKIKDPVARKALTNAARQLRDE